MTQTICTKYQNTITVQITSAIPSLHVMSCSTPVPRKACVTAFPPWNTICAPLHAASSSTLTSRVFASTWFAGLRSNCGSSKPSMCSGSKSAGASEQVHSSWLPRLQCVAAVCAWCDVEDAGPARRARSSRPRRSGCSCATYRAGRPRRCASCSAPCPQARDTVRGRVQARFQVRAILLRDIATVAFFGSKMSFTGRDLVNCATRAFSWTR